VGQDHDKNDWRQKHRNKLDQLEKKIRYDRKHGFRNQASFDYLGGFLKYHKWHAALASIILINMSILFQNSSLIYFYLLGLVITVKDTIKKAFNTGEIVLSPVTFYLVAASVFIVVFAELGYPVPEVTWGLIHNTAEVLS